MAYLSAEVIIKTKKNGIKIDDIIKYYQSLSDNVVTVGVHTDAGQDNVKKMLWNEFGTNHKLERDSVAIPNVGLKPVTKNTSQFIEDDLSNFVEEGADISIPARPVVRMYLYPRILQAISFNYANNIDIEINTKLHNPIRSAERVQNKLGEACVNLQRQKMSSGNFAPIDNKGKDQNNNSPLTQKIKGYNHPYFETGELVSKINYKVRKRG